MDYLNSNQVRYLFLAPGDSYDKPGLSFIGALRCQLTGQYLASLGIEVAAAFTSSKLLHQHTITAIAIGVNQTFPCVTKKILEPKIFRNTQGIESTSDAFKEQFQCIAGTHYRGKTILFCSDPAKILKPFSEYLAKSQIYKKHTGLMPCHVVSIIYNLVKLETVLIAPLPRVKIFGG